MNEVRFSDIIAAFSDFVTCLENADEFNFRHAKKFCLDVLRHMTFGQRTVFGVKEDE